MSNLDEQQPERETPAALGQDDIEAFANQTPVGATKAHQKAKGKKRRRLTVWVSTLAAVAVLAGAAFAFWPGPADEPDEPDEPDVPDTAVTLLDKQYNADGTEIEKPVKSIHITSRLDEFSLALDDDGILRLADESPLPVNSLAVDSLVKAVTLIEAQDTIATGLSDMAEYGLEDPTATVEVTYADGETAKLELAALAVGSHYYLRLNGGDTVYLLDSTLPTEVMQTAEAFVGLTVIAAPSVSPDDPNGSAAIKELSLTGPVRNNQITTVRRWEEGDDEEFANATYIMTAPYRIATDTSVITDVFSVTEISAGEVVALHPTDKQLEDYGLKEPHSVAKIVMAIYTYTENEDGTAKESGYYNEMTHLMLLGNKTDDGHYYAMADTLDVIFLVNGEDVPWAERTYHDFASRYLFLRNLTTLSSISCTLEGRTYDFCFEHFPEEEELDDQLRVTVDGQQHDTDDFRTLYQVLMTLYRTGPAPAAPGGEPLLTVRVTSLNKAYAVNEVKIYPYSGSVYIVQTETGDTYKTTASLVDDAIQQIKNYLNGDPVINRF